MSKLSESILEVVAASGKRGMSAPEVGRIAGVGTLAAKEVLRTLENDGKLVFKKGTYYTLDSLGLISAVIVRLATKFAFARNMETGEEYFLPGRFTMGAMTGDTVLLEVLDEEGRSPTGQVMKITEYAQAKFLGRVVLDESTLCVCPMSSKNSMNFQIGRGQTKGAKVGDRVLAEIYQRGRRHSEHKVRILKIYGTGENPQEISKGVLDEAGVEKSFSMEVLRQGKDLQDRGITEQEMEGRTDLRGLPIFTIDGADTKDIDDAVSVERTAEGYRLGVHIADVSHYVKTGTPIDEEAFDRGTSIYYANQVIPMIPKQLSNGICSLNPQEDRLAFSALMEIDRDFTVTSYQFRKSIIHSRVKGVYSELNSLLDGSEDPQLKEKYSQVLDCLPLMKELYDGLSRKMKERGCPEIDTPEAKIIVDENGEVTDIKLRERGISEQMIEQFMLCANEAAANFARINQLPILYRVHEAPDPDRVETLAEMLRRLGIPSKMIRPGLVAGDMQKAIELSKETKYDKIINYQVLRTMAKATYSPEPKGHFSLALEDYAHFTSPIRRYPDLYTHRVMSAFLKGHPHDKIVKKYTKRCKEAATQSSSREVRALEIERRCDDIYKASYMKKHVGEIFTGTISSIAPHGIYVMLSNTVEGLIRIEDPALRDADIILSYKDRETGREYAMGDEVPVLLSKVDVELGQLTFDFVTPSDTEKK